MPAKTGANPSTKHANPPHVEDDVSPPAGQAVAGMHPKPARREVAPLGSATPRTRMLFQSDTMRVLFPEPMPSLRARFQGKAKEAVLPTPSA